MNRKAAVILSGCGYLDGSEIHETTLLFLALRENNITYHSFAPNRDQTVVVDHKTQKETSEKRNILRESARIARGDVQDIKNLKESDFDFLCLPGGYGVARNLSNLAEVNSGFSVDFDVAKWIVAFYEAKKPILAICIAPAIVSKVLEDKGVMITLGTNENDLKMIEAMGNKPISCKVDEVCADKKHHIYTVPGYMEPPNIAGIYTSLKKAVAFL